ncbi:MAG: 23S rRNA (adenine(2503)-C(2))-methyltransferase RlmN [Gammaproteobacteria bacterium]|nr:23S rRNA (adenine(2503)-C(2))-methyltransferase RlmN [Gammaproteobacteria bacterium]
MSTLIQFKQQSLLGVPRQQLEEIFEQMGSKPFHARQVMQWMYQRGEADIEQMTDLSKSLREKLQNRTTIPQLKLLSEHQSPDDTIKWLFDVDGGQAIETVFIPEKKRGTLCVSSQVGCALDCSFCATGAQGFNRNLSAAEIIGQVWHAETTLRNRFEVDSAISNVVFMGMGEPLANYRNVLPALKILTDEFGFGLSKRRVTVSTSGIVPTIEQLQNDHPVALAVSLHAPDNELRDQLVPINRRYSIEQLLAACWQYAQALRRTIFFEYVMLAGVNDSVEHAQKLAALLRDRPAKINLIPFNPYPGGRYQSSSYEQIVNFQKVLLNAGLRTMIRRTRGSEVAAACGQLAGRVENKVLKPLGKKHALSHTEQ